MSVQIIINGESANEAIIELSTLAAGLSGKQAAPAVNVPVTEPEKPKRQTRQTAKPEVKEEPEVKPEPDVKEEDDEDFLCEADEPIPTEVELRQIAKDKSDADPKVKPAIKALLDKYGAKNITGIPADKRIAFKRELEAL